MKIFLPALSTILVLIVLASQVKAQPQAGPFGLTWGMSQADARSLGVLLNTKETGKFGVEAGATNLPKALSDTLNVALYFGFNDHLWRVVSVSNLWEHDRTGAQARNRFGEVSNLLTQRYGKSINHFDTPSSQFFSDIDQFSYGLGTNNRVYFSEWSTKDISVELSIRGKMESTFYVIIYEFKPLAADVQTHMQVKEKEAL
jgi:hypothetical protein